MNYDRSQSLTQKRLKEVIEYIPYTGEFFRLEYNGKKSGRTSIKNRGKAGLVIQIDGIRYSAHRLAFLYVAGEFPEGVVRHIDGEPNNFKWDNLRESSNRGSVKLTQKRLIELLDYDPLDGIFTRKHGIGSGGKGYPAGCIKEGYIYIGVDGNEYAAHRLVFLYVDGFMPEDGIDVDHIDRNRENNRRSNLRLASRQCNARNSTIRKSNISGVTGVSKYGDFWKARIMVSYKDKYLGQYNHFDDAVKARWDGEVKYNFPNCCTTSSAYEYLKKHNLI